MHTVVYGHPMHITNTAVSRFLTDWYALTAYYHFTYHTIRRFLEQAGWTVLEIRNQQKGWSGPENQGFRSSLFSTYRALLTQSKSYPPVR